MSKVLIIDDEPGVAAALRIRLQSAGYEVSTAACGQSGIDEAESCRPDVIFLDIRLSDIDGFEVFRRVKDMPHLHSVPIVFLSANVHGPSRARIEELDAQGFLSKPYDYAHVITTLEAVVSSSNASHILRTES